MQLGGQQFGLVAGGSDLGLQGGQFLVGVRNGVELCGIAVSERNQFALVGRTVLLAKRIERIETVVHLLQPFGVGLDALAVLGERRGDVFELFEHRTQPSGQVCGVGITPAQPSDLHLGVLDLRQHPDFVPVEGVAHGRDRLADPIGIGQHGLFRFQFGDFARTQARSRQLLRLIAEPLFVAPGRVGLRTQAGAGALQLLQTLVFGAIRRPQFAVAGHGIERFGAELLRGEDQVLMLRMDVDEPAAEFAQLRELHRQVVDVGAALAGRS